MTTRDRTDLATLRVGGPMLSRRDLHSKSKRAKKHKHPVAWDTLEPLLYDDGSEQFILMPNERFVTVLAYKTGRTIAHLIPTRVDEESNVLIQSACIANLPKKLANVNVALQEQMTNDSGDDTDEEDDTTVTTMMNEEQILLLGCQDGTLREFALALLTCTKTPMNHNPDCGYFQLQGPCFRPRRVFGVKDGHVFKHLTAPNNTNLNDGALLFAVSEIPNSDSIETDSNHFISQRLYRIMLTVFDVFTQSDTNTIQLTKKEVAVKEEIKCPVGVDKFGNFNDTSTFRLLSVSRKSNTGFSEQNDRDVFCVLVRSNGFQIYHEHLIPSDSGVVTSRYPMVTFATKDGDTITSLAISPNGNDLACGYWLGDIRVMTKIIPTVLDYHRQLAQADKEKSKKPEHPSKSLLIRRVHWHAHPVMAVTYHGLSDAVDPMLYSGGEESVLVVWQLSKGTSAPADILPRIALDGIVHIAAINPNGILIYCEDNTLQLVRAHNRKRIWKVHGLTTPGDESNILVDPKSDSSLILTGLVGAPGFLHWFDPREHRVTYKLEVAPYNRVSRAGQADNPMPAPEVTQVALSKSGDVIMTVEVIPTENACVGAPHYHFDEELGTITALKFWTHGPSTTEEGKSLPYAMSAVMTFPHGEENQISAIALSPNGDVACTVSNDEKAFRVWRRILADAIPADDDHTKSRRTPIWICQYKVTTPSGLSNQKTSRGGVTFSPDGSILAICYGHLISLWNHKESVLVNTIKHSDCTCIDSIQFYSTATKADMVMTKSKSEVFVQSPFGSKGQKGWKFTLPSDCREARILHAHFLFSHDMVAISTFHVKKQSTRVVLMDATTGLPKNKMTWDIPGKVVSVVSTGVPNQSAVWVKFGPKPQEVKETSVRLYAVVGSGEMLLLKTGGNDEDCPRRVIEVDDIVRDAPRIHVPQKQKNRKRLRATSIADEEPLAKRAHTIASLSAFMGTDESGGILTSDLPSLGGAFARAFVGRNLAKSSRVVSSAE